MVEMLWLVVLEPAADKNRLTTKIFNWHELIIRMLVRGCLIYNPGLGEAFFNKENICQSAERKELWATGIKE